MASGYSLCTSPSIHGMWASGRDESRPYIPDGGHLLPVPLTAGEKCGLDVMTVDERVRSPHLNNRRRQLLG